MRAMNKNALDIGGSRRSAVKTGVAVAVEFGPTVGVLNHRDDRGRIEKHDQMLREVRDGICDQRLIDEQDRTGLGDTERCAGDGNIDIREVPRMDVCEDLTVARKIGNGRSDDLCVREQLVDAASDVSSMVTPAHAFQILEEKADDIAGSFEMKTWEVRQGVRA